MSEEKKINESVKETAPVNETTPVKENSPVKETAPVKEKSDFLRNTVILFAITLIAAILLGIVYEITKDPIAEQQAKRKNEAYAAVFPGLSETKEDSSLTDFAAEYKETLSKQGIENVTISEA